jgi:hypothetical protein
MIVWLIAWWHRNVVDDDPNLECSELDRKDGIQ